MDEVGRHIGTASNDLANYHALPLAVPGHFDRTVGVDLLNNTDMAFVMAPIGSGPLLVPVGHGPHGGSLILVAGCPLNPLRSVAPACLFTHAAFRQTISNVAGAAVIAVISWVASIRPGTSALTIAAEGQAAIATLDLTQSTWLSGGNLCLLGHQHNAGSRSQDPASGAILRVFPH